MTVSVDDLGIGAGCDLVAHPSSPVLPKRHPRYTQYGQRRRSSPIAPLKTKGDLAEMMVAADLMRRGYKIALPYGEDWDFDLIVCRDGETLERVQVKHSCSDGEVIRVKCFSHSLTNGKVRSTKRYTVETIDWLAVYDAGTGDCCYVPASELGSGMSNLHLRLRKARNNQQTGIRLAKDYLDL
ncbi:MAG: group I intron-associated PD-(D/E)XK endonuclease [Thermoleophilaceae bacterium]